MAVKEGDDSVLLGWPGLITCAQFVVVLSEKMSKTRKERERGREKERVKGKDRRRESRAHTLALSCSLSLSFSLILVSIRKTSKSQLETGKQPPESCPAQHGANVSDIGDNSAFFWPKS